MVEVVGADPVALAALKLPGMTLDRWTSFLPFGSCAEPAC